MITTNKYILAPGVRQLIAQAGADGDGIRALIYVETEGNHAIAIGDSTVTMANGVHLYKRDKIEILVEAGEKLYAIADLETDIRVMLSGVFV